MDQIKFRFGFDVEEIALSIEGDPVVEEMTVEGQDIALQVDYDDDVEQILTSLEGIQNPATVTDESSTESSQESIFQFLAENDFFNLFGTPGNDIPFGEKPISDYIQVREGVDRIIGVNPADPQPGRGEFDILLDLPFTIEGFTPSTPEGELFVLGDENNPYYASGESMLGIEDVAVIVDFEPDKDFIRLHGTQNDYFLAEYSSTNLSESSFFVGSGTAIYLNNSETNEPDIVAMLDGVDISELSLDADYFEYDNTPPPQEPESDGVIQIGTPGSDNAEAIVSDGEGFIYTAGFTSGVLGQANIGSTKDGFLAKYDSRGNQRWIRQIGTSGIDNAFGTNLSADGNDLYVIGNTSGDLAAANQGGDDVWVAKYDTFGQQQWIRQYGTPGLDTIFGVDSDAEGNVYTAGYTTSDLGATNNNDSPDAPNPYTTDSYVTKFDSEGNQLWITQFGTVGLDDTYSLAVDHEGNIFTAGHTDNDLAGPNAGEAGVYDAWISKFDSDGNQLWTQQFGSPDYEFNWDVDTDSEGNVYSVGWTAGSLEGSSAGGYDVFLAKYDTDGNQQWIEQFGSAGSDHGFALDIDSNDTIYVTGYTDDVLEGDNAGGDIVGADDAFVATFDSDGNQLELQQFGSSGVDRARDISVGAPGEIALSGFTDGSFGSANFGDYDAWLTQSSIDTI